MPTEFSIAETTGRRPPIGGPTLTSAAAVLVAALTASATMAHPGDGPSRSAGADVSAPPHQPIYFPLEPRRGVVADGDDEVPEDVLRLFMRYHTSMQYERAAECALRLTRVAPDRPLSHYNLACVMARLHRAEGSLDALELAVDLGWRQRLHTTLDPDLRVVRGTDRFRRLVERMDRLIESERLPAGPLRDDPWPEISRDLDAAIPSLMAQHHVPGMTVALIHDGEMVWTEAYGVADRDQAAPMARDDRFCLRGPQHLLAAVAALQQEQRGRLTLGELVEYQEEAQRAARGGDPAPAFRLVTLGGRSDGTAGRAAGSAPTAAALGAGHAGFSTMGVSPSFYRLLVAAVEMSCDAPGAFPEICRRDILEPLEMERTAWLPSPRAGEGPEYVVGHSLFGTAVRAAREGRDDLGGTTAGDLGRLLAGLLAERADGFTTTLGPDPLGRLAAAIGRPATALGIRVDQTACGPRLRMAELRDGVGCLLVGYPRSRAGVVIMFNAETGPEAAHRVALRTLGGDPLSPGRAGVLERPDASGTKAPGPSRPPVR